MGAEGVAARGFGRMRKLGIRGANYLERASETPEDWYYTNANGVAFTVEERAHLLKGGCNAVTPQQLTAPVYAEVKDLDETTRMQYVDLYFWLVGDILLKTDKMSMAHSLESRVPFLDRRVFDVSATIPTPLKANESQTKLTLREASERAIPKDWAQKEKLGFPVPVVNWLREDRYYNQVKEWFTGDITAGSSAPTSLFACLTSIRPAPIAAARYGSSTCSLCGTRSTLSTKRSQKSRRRASNISLFLGSGPQPSRLRASSFPAKLLAVPTANGHRAATLMHRFPWNNRMSAVIFRKAIDDAPKDSAFRLRAF